MVSKVILEKSVTVDNTVAAVAAVCRRILDLVRDNGFSRDDIFAVHLSLEEALINAIKHGNHFDPARKVRVSADVGAEQTTITVCDEGAGFDPSVVPDPTADENLEKPSGRGIMLIRAYMDEVEYIDRGQTVRMLKRKG